MEYNDKDFQIDVELRQRKKKKVKKRYTLRFFKILNIIAFSITLLIVSVCFIILKRPEISEIENRTLAKWPSFSISKYFSGKYTAGIENCYNDTVPGREYFKNLVSEIRDNFGIASSEVKIHGSMIKQDNSSKTPKVTTINTDIGLSQTSITSVSKAETTQTAVITTQDPLDDPNIEGEISNNILVYKNRGIMLYGGSYSNGELYAQYVNGFKENLGDSVNVYSMVCPTPVSYYLPKKYSDMTASEEDNICNINDYLEDVTPIDAYNALMEHKDENIFQRTDHHWSQLGAFYAAEKFAEEADVPFSKLNSYEKVVKEGYVGTLYGYTGDNDLRDNPEEFIYYKPQNKYTTEFFSTDLSEQWEGNLLINLDNLDPVSWYLVFMGTDQAVTHVKTDVGNGRKLAIIKDSYGNALAPCLTGSFEEIYVIDMRYFDVNAVSTIKDWGITDLLFAMNTFSATGSNFECIEQIRTQ
jgi:hypothetical protein